MLQPAIVPHLYRCTEPGCGARGRLRASPGYGFNPITGELVDLLTVRCRRCGRSVTAPAELLERLISLKVTVENLYTDYGGEG